MYNTLNKIGRVDLDRIINKHSRQEKNTQLSLLCFD